MKTLYVFSGACDFGGYGRYTGGVVVCKTGVEAAKAQIMDKFEKRDISNIAVVFVSQVDCEETGVVFFKGYAE
jgi:hypothetical protein